MDDVEIVLVGNKNDNQNDIVVNRNDALSIS